MSIVYLSSAELKPIVQQWGGTLKFSRVIGVRERTVFRWLADGVKTEPVAKLIQSLKAGDLQ